MGRLFPVTGRALIDVQKRELKLQVNGEKVAFNMFKTIRYLKGSYNCFAIDAIEELICRSHLDQFIWREVEESQRRPALERVHPVAHQTQSK